MAKITDIVGNELNFGDYIYHGTGLTVYTNQSKLTGNPIRIEKIDSNDRDGMYCMLLGLIGMVYYNGNDLMFAPKLDCYTLSCTIESPIPPNTTHLPLGKINSRTLHEISEYTFNMLMLQYG